MASPAFCINCILGTLTGWNYISMPGEWNRLWPSDFFPYLTEVLANTALGTDPRGVQWFGCSPFDSSSTAVVCRSKQPDSARNGLFGSSPQSGQAATGTCHTIGLGGQGPNPNCILDPLLLIPLSFAEYCIHSICKPKKNIIWR